MRTGRNALYYTARGYTQRNWPAVVIEKTRSPNLDALKASAAHRAGFTLGIHQEPFALTHGTGLLPLFHASIVLALQEKRSDAAPIEAPLTFLPMGYRGYT